MRRLKQLRCSFCRKTESQVEKLVAGPRVFICDACVAIATEIMNDPHGENNPPAGQRSVWRRLFHRVRPFAGRHLERQRLPVAAH
jgi:ATP-dependent protease Clp ATPase subunit